MGLQQAIDPISEESQLQQNGGNDTAKSVIFYTLKTAGGTVGAYPVVKTITPGTGFTITATAGDTSVYNYAVIESNQ